MPEPEELSREELIKLVRDQAARLDGQELELERLRADLERLRRLLSRNSGNSSMPPSTDDLPGRGRSKKEKPAAGTQPGGGVKRKRGKQPGAAGTTLAWAKDAEVVDHRPEGVCGCGADLAGATDAGVDRACQVTDIPRVTAKTTEHRMRRVRCACGREHIGQAPPEAATGAAMVFGPNLASLVVYLLVFQFVPVERCRQLVFDLTGADPSAGFVHGMLGRCADELAGVTKLIKALVILARVVHFDETTLRVGRAGVKKYVWAACTDRYTVFALGRRTGVQFQEFGVGPGFGGVAVHDRYAVYDMSDSFADGVRHQVCCAHVLRDLQDAAECYPKANWPIQCARALRGLIHAANRARDAGFDQVDPVVRERLITEFRQGVLVGLKEVPRRGGPKAKQLPARSLLEDLRDREDDITRFCFDTTIPATNNQAERDLRPHKTQQKISGRLTSEEVTKDRLTIRGYISTAMKHGVNVLTALRMAVTRQPWIPPAAAGLSSAGP